MGKHIPLSVFLLCSMLIYQSCDTSNNSRKLEHLNKDFNPLLIGTYKGVTPCPDCRKIEVTLTLDSDSSFTYNSTYWGKGGNTEFVDLGRWFTQADTIILDYDDESIPEAKVLIVKDSLAILELGGNVVKKVGWLKKVP